ncbi:hypothetical protein DFH09DRAFT_1290093 [Mycena vulgaris]|nr:hypothetical protein DFH09DRAFT_1290093 [Mycena vulgaris]
MAPVLSKLTAEYLLVFNQSAGHAPHPLFRNAQAPELQLSDLVKILTAIFKLTNSKLTNAPVTYQTAVAAIIKENVGVDWAVIKKGGSKVKGVERVMAQLLNRNKIKAPSLQPARRQSSPLSDDPTPESPPKTKTEPENTGSGRQDEEKGVDKDKDEEPSGPEKLCRIWAGSSEDFSEQRDAISWDFIFYDSTGDFKLHDPKVIVVNYIGDDSNDMIVKRFNAADLSKFITYYGRNRTPDGPSIVDDKSELEDGFTVNLFTKGLIKKLIVDRVRHSFSEDVAYQVTWALPGATSPLEMPPLLTYHPEDVPALTWNVGDNDTLLAVGPANALRIILSITPYRHDDIPQITETERINRLVVEYLLSLHGTSPIIREVRLANSNTLTKHKGRTPEAWYELVRKIAQANDVFRVPQSVLNDARGKKIQKVHLAGMCLTTATWIGQCLEAAAVIKHKRSAAATLFFAATTPSMGIDKFKSALNDLDAYKRHTILIHHAKVTPGIYFCFLFPGHTEWFYHLESRFSLGPEFPCCESPTQKRFGAAAVRTHFLSLTDVRHRKHLLLGLEESSQVPDLKHFGGPSWAGRSDRSSPALRAHAPLPRFRPRANRGAARALHGVLPRPAAAFPFPTFYGLWGNATASLTYTAGWFLERVREVAERLKKKTTWPHSRSAVVSCTARTCTTRGRTLTGTGRGQSISPYAQPPADKYPRMNTRARTPASPFAGMNTRGRNHAHAPPALMAPTRFSATENLRMTTPEPTSGDRAAQTKPRAPTAASTSARSHSHNASRRRQVASSQSLQSPVQTCHALSPTSDPNVDPRTGIIAHEQPTAETRARTCTPEPMHPNARTQKAAPGE